MDLQHRLKGSGVIRQSPSHGNARYGRLARRLHWEIGVLLGPAVRKDAVAIVEQPTYQDSENGILLARKKNLPKLFGAAAACLSALAILGIDYAFVPAGTWKRKVPKDIIHAKLDTLFPAKAGEWEREDEWEAVGLALWGCLRADEGVYEVFNMKKHAGDSCEHRPRQRNLEGPET